MLANLLRDIGMFYAFGFFVHLVLVPFVIIPIIALCMKDENKKAD